MKQIIWKIVADLLTLYVSVELLVVLPIAPSSIIDDFSVWYRQEFINMNKMPHSPPRRNNYDKLCLSNSITSMIILANYGQISAYSSCYQFNEPIKMPVKTSFTMWKNYRIYLSAVLSHCCSGHIDCVMSKVCSLINWWRASFDSNISNTSAYQSLRFDCLITNNS